jgi:hypothetical protein
MTSRPKINPSSTYVLDEADIEQLDELTLTSMVTALVEIAHEGPPEPPADLATSLPAGDAAINEILAASSADQKLERSDVLVEPETTDDLLAADVLFPELTPERRD